MTALPSRNERNSFAPTQALLPGILLPLACYCLLAWFYLSSPWIGVELERPTEGEGIVVAKLAENGPATGRLHPGDIIVNVVSANGVRLPLDAATISPEGGYGFVSRAQFDSFFARHATLFEASQSGALTLELADASSVQIDVGKRSLIQVPLGFWVGMTSGLLAALVGLGIWVFRPNDSATRVFAVHGMAMFVAATAASVINNRELVMDPFWLKVLTQMNLAGVIVGTLTIAALMWYYPHPLNRFPMAKLLSVVGLVVLSVGIAEANLSPVLLFQTPIMLALLVLFPLFGFLQWRMTRQALADRAALQWFLLVVGLTVAVIVAANLLPVALGYGVILSTSMAYALILLMYIGLAFGVVRYRLFNLGEWWFEAMVWALSGALVIALDASLLALTANLSISLAVSLGVAGWAYFPLRQWLWRMVNPAARQNIEHHLPELIETLFTARSLDELVVNWRLLLERVYQPLSISYQAMDKHTDAPMPGLDEEGLMLRMPSIDETHWLELRHGHKGRRLFTSADLRLANAMLALTQQAAVLRQAEDERLRLESAREREKLLLLQDLHDGVGGLTTNIALLAETTQREETHPRVRANLGSIAQLAREALGEVRNVMQTLDEEELDWTGICANLRVSGRDMLEAHGIDFGLKSTIGVRCHEPDSIFALNVYRIFKESLTNIVKHAQATNVSVEVDIRQERFCMVIRDNGVGCEAARQRSNRNGVMSGGHGLKSIGARAARLGGRLVIAERDGTSITLEVPLPANLPEAPPVVSLHQAASL